MKEINTAQMGTAGGVKAKLPRPVEFNEGRGCARQRVEIIVGVKNTTGGPLDYTGARAKKALSCLASQHTLAFGNKVQDIVDNALPYERARELALAMASDDFKVLVAGVPKSVKDLADADVVSAAVAAGATVKITFEWVRPFELIRLGEDAYSYCPGVSQMRQMQLEFVRGATFDPDGNFAQDGSADFTFIADDFDAQDDKWSPIVRLYTQEEAGQISHGPGGTFGLLALWDYNAAGAATALTRFSITRKGDTPLHDNARASVVVRDAGYTDPAGTYDLNGIVTVLHAIPDATDKNEIPTGRDFQFIQPGSELAPAKTAWLYVPARSTEEIDLYVGENVKDEDGVKTILAAAKAAKGLGSTAASMEPVILARRGSADFEVLPGRVYAKNLSAQTHIPAAVQAAAASQASGAGDAETKAAAASKVANVIAKSVPGGASAVRGAKTGFFATLRSRFAK